LIHDAEALRGDLLSRLKPRGRPDVRRKLIPLVRKPMQATIVSETSSQTHIRMQQARHDEEQHSEKGTHQILEYFRFVLLIQTTLAHLRVRIPVRKFFPLSSGLEHAEYPFKYQPVIGSGATPFGRGRSLGMRDATYFHRLSVRYTTRLLTGLAPVNCL
jgi:hypothetical protein